MPAIPLGSTLRVASRAGKKSVIPKLQSPRGNLQISKSLGKAVVPQGRLHSTSSETPFPPSSSVSASEVSHFSQLASTWWDPHGPSRLLHLMNPLRHDFIRSCMRSSESPPPDTLSYLDIGCGGGIFASSAARLPNTSSVTAIDPTELVIQVAKTQQRSDPGISPPKLQYLNCAIEDLPIPETESQKVDILTVFEVLEHINNPNAFLELAIPHLKTGGWIIGSTIARSAMAYITTKLIAEAPFIGVVPAGTHDWNKYINPRLLREYFARKETGSWGSFKVQGVIYVPAIGWKPVNKTEDLGNYFFGIQKLA